MGPSIFFFFSSHRKEPKIKVTFIKLLNHCRLYDNESIMSPRKSIIYLWPFWCQMALNAIEYNVIYDNQKTVQDMFCALQTTPFATFVLVNYKGICICKNIDAAIAIRPLHGRGCITRRKCS